MSELAPIASSTTSMLISLALDAATVRHAAIAQNIANANNEGYRPLQVDFDRQVALYRDELLGRRDEADPARTIDALRASIRTNEAPDGEAARVELDVEVAKMTQNALHYQALLAARSKLGALMRLAIGGGR